MAMNKITLKIFLLLFLAGVFSDNMMAQTTREVSVSVANNEVHNMTERRYAELMAWEQAISEVCGMNIKTSTVSLDFANLSEIVNFDIYGMIISDSLVSTSSYDTIIKQVDVRVFDYTFDVVVKCKEQIQPDFGVKIKMITAYNPGDELDAIIYPSKKKLYLYIFGIWEDGNMALLYPMYFLSSIPQKSRFGSDDPLQTPFIPGVSFPAQNNTDHNLMEVLVAVATESEWSLEYLFSRDKTFGDNDQSLSLDKFNKWLVQIPQNKRAINWKQYHIAKKQ